MKVLLKRKLDLGLFVFVGNDRPFVVATLEKHNGVGNLVSSWHNGTYFHTLDEAEVFYDKDNTEG